MATSKSWDPAYPIVLNGRIFPQEYASVVARLNSATAEETCDLVCWVSLISCLSICALSASVIFVTCAFRSLWLKLVLWAIALVITTVGSCVPKIWATAYQGSKRNATMQGAIREINEAHPKRGARFSYHAAVSELSPANVMITITGNTPVSSTPYNSHVFQDRKSGSSDLSPPAYAPSYGSIL